MRPILTFALLASCTGTPADPDPSDQDPYDVQIGPYEATVRWTSHGIPHIQGVDTGSLGYGMGYAFARDHICTLADQIVKVRGERSRHFGPGDENEHVNSDFGWLHIGVVRQAEEGFLDLPAEIRDAMVGYAAGYNRWLSENEGDLPPACNEAPWVKPVTHIDLLAYYLHLGGFGSAYPLVELVGEAQPPSGRRAMDPPGLEAFEQIKNPPIASNGWGIGSTRTSTSRGMLLSNTHFPMEGERQWHESHLTIPGVVDVYGVSLMGVPIINMGFNDRVAWTHTVSNTPRFTAYQLELVDGDPTAYTYDGEVREMTSETYTIEVLQEDGSLSSQSRTLYNSHYGPMFAAPLIGWTPLLAFTYRDANEGNLEIAETWFDMNKATSLEEFQAAHREHQGIPWVHTMYADTEGNAWYTDSSRTPYLTPEAEEAYDQWLEDSLWAPLFSDFGIFLFDGGDPVYEWQTHPDAIRPGILPFSENPQLLRDDYVANANQNYWATNPEEPLSGFPMLYGDAPTPLTPRTRMNLTMLRRGDPASGADDLFTLEELKAAAVSGRGKLAELLKDDVADRCDGVGEVSIVVEDDDETREVTVDISESCASLAAWDTTSRVDARGAHVWREFIGSGVFEISDLGDEGTLFADPFDETNPVATPGLLAEAPPNGLDPMVEAMAFATYRLDEAGLDPDARLGDVQFRRKGDTQHPTPGGTYQEGVIQVAYYGQGGNSTLLPVPERGEVINDATVLTDEGYLINDGNSWIMAMEFTDDGPQAEAVLVYSQSEDPRSPYYTDQSDLYASETFRPVLFREADIAADPNLETLELVLE